MNALAHIGEALALHAKTFPDRIGARDLERAMSFREWHARACRLANALLGLGLQSGDRVCVLAYNCIEWVEIYAACAYAGLVAVPINFRLVGPEIQYIVENAEARALIFQDEFLETVDGLKGNHGVPSRNHIIFGAKRAAGFTVYEDLIASARDTRPDASIALDDPWALMYTSGTTGKPKGAIRTHRGSAMLALVSAAEFSITRNDTALLVMPLCHANSLFFFGAFSYSGATCSIYSRKSFDPEHFLKTMAEGGATFTSLVPTHYIMMLALSESFRNTLNVDAVTKLLVSSAPARRDTKLAVMEYFKNSGLYELYGSTEAGWVTMLHPDEQFTKLGSVGRETVGSKRIKLLDRDGNEVPDGEPGELYSCNAQTFVGYWKLPEKTKDAFRGDYCTVGDLARRDEEGYIHLVDRKSNMIISGGENVYPSEVETMLGGHPDVKDVAVIGVADAKWGERVHAVIIPHAGKTISEGALLDWCKDKIAGYKRPRSASFIKDEEMPRTATGKILHRILRDRHSEKPK